MDERTKRAYSELAENYSNDWLNQPAPVDMYELLKKYLIRAGKTADIGCGNGRDAFWLNSNGFPTVGFDSSEELLKIAEKIYPKMSFYRAHLPELKEIHTKFDNLICETVIMHLPADQIAAAVSNLKRVLSEDGVLYLSWRVTEEKDSRHQDGRLYSAFNTKDVLKHFPETSVLHFEDTISKSSGKRICRVIYKHRMHK